MPTAPNGFFATVDAYEVNKLYSEDQPLAVTDSLLTNGVKFTSTKQVYVDSKVIYRITVKYNSTLINENGTNVTIGPDTFNVKPRVLDNPTFRDEIKAFASLSGVRVTNNNYFDYTITPNGESGTASHSGPTIEILINGVWATVPLRNGGNTLDVTPPIVVFTKKNTAPQVPPNVQLQDEGYIMGADERRVQWNACTKEWVRIWLWDVVQVNPTAEEIKRKLGPKYEVYISAKYYDEIGIFKREKFLTTSSTQLKRSSNKKKDINYTRGDKKAGKTGWTEATRLLNEAKNCANLPSSTTTTEDGKTPDVTVDPGESPLFNPPPHSTTRHFNSIARWPSDQYSKKVPDTFNQLGVIYTDPSNMKYKKSTDGKSWEVVKGAGSMSHKWGFRFLYNPTTWSYAFSQDNSGVDWSRGNENGAILPAGTGTISLQLLIDRVADMNAVRDWDKNGRTNNPGLPYYPFTLRNEACAGILYRGTEYDLEYFYRVLNNDVAENPLFGGAGSSTSTAPGLETFSSNLGYVTSLPFMLKFNDQLRYKVVLSGVTINHDIFTKEMIPIRTVVNLQLERIPDWFYDQTTDLEKRIVFDAENQIIALGRTNLLTRRPDRSLRTK